MIETGKEISIAKQCELLGLARSSHYYQAASETEENLKLMEIIDQQYLKTPFYGSRRMSIILRKNGHLVNRKRVQRLMRIMGLEGMAPGPKDKKPAHEHKKYPYLLRGKNIERKDEVWSTDITYIPMNKGFMYLVAVMDWYSRFVLSWELSNTLDTDFCLTALEKALRGGKPGIFNTDQGVQFTSIDFTKRLEKEDIEISMDGKGRALDNIFIERLWRSLKYEDIYPKRYETVMELYDGVGAYFSFYNRERPHQSLNNMTPHEVYFGGIP